MPATLPAARTRGEHFDDAQERLFNRTDCSVDDERAGKTVEKTDLNVGRLGRNVAGDHRRFARRQRHDPDRLCARNADLLGQIVGRMRDQVRQRDLLAGNEFLNAARERLIRFVHGCLYFRTPASSKRPLSLSQTIINMGIQKVISRIGTNGLKP